ncbi:MAG: D-glycerate dehydrogenase, partial [Solirubrobacterales bacterium]|nr:D-glycerate dehydrogenase [Solirubrobacterales bacterium]
MAKPRVVVAVMLPAAGLDLLRERFIVDSAGNGAENGPLLARVPGATAIVADPAIPIHKSVLDAAGGSLAVVAN